VPLPPVPPIGFAGGTLRWQFKFETYVKVYWNSEKSNPVCGKTGWCGEVGASAKLEAEIPLVGPLKFGAWGKIEGKVGACLVVKWLSKTSGYLTLEGYGKVAGEIGAKIFIGDEFNVFGLKAKLEIGINAELKAESDLQALSIWIEGGPYLEAKAEGWLNYSYEWNSWRFVSPKYKVSYASLTSGGGGW
jgi:hypothetical protein